MRQKDEIAEVLDIRVADLVLPESQGEAVENFSDHLEVKGRSLWDDARRRFFSNRAALTSLIILGLIMVGVLVWAVKSGQYDDMEGDANRIIMDDDDDLITFVKCLHGNLGSNFLTNSLSDLWCFDAMI